MKHLAAITTFLLCLLFWAPAHALCAKVDHADLHRDASSDSPVTWKVGKNMPLRKLATRGSWFRVVDLDGARHWVSAAAVRDENDCAVVRVPFAHLKQTPSRSSANAEPAVADKYTPFRKLDQRDEWLLLEDDYHQKFWIAESNVWTPIVKMVINF